MGISKNAIDFMFGIEKNAKICCKKFCRDLFTNFNKFMSEKGRFV